MRETQNRSMGQGPWRWHCAVVLLGSLAACGPRASDGMTTPGGAGAVPEGPRPEGYEEGDNIGDLKARLDRLHTQQATMDDRSDASFDVCEDLCSLASSICSIKVKLCEIAERHPGEDEYQRLCRQAELECGEAEDSCVACVEARSSEPTSGAAP